MCKLKQQNKENYSLNTPNKKKAIKYVLKFNIDYILVTETKNLI